MNSARRRLLAQAVELLQAGRDQIWLVAAEERAAFENLPEGIQDAERGQAMSEAADELDELVADLGEMLSWIEALAL